MRISDWSSDVCSSDLIVLREARVKAAEGLDAAVAGELKPLKLDSARFRTVVEPLHEPQWSAAGSDRVEFEIATNPGAPFAPLTKRSEEHTSELQSLMRISYAVFCLKKNTTLNSTSTN